MHEVGLTAFFFVCVNDIAVLLFSLSVVPGWSNDKIFVFILECSCIVYVHNKTSLK
jgi:hypothetical protein